MTTTDLTTTARTAAEKFDMDETAAESAAREYLAQISALDGVNYDEEELPTEVTEFIIESIHQSRTDVTVTPLDRVAEAAEKVASVEGALAMARQDRTATILTAIDAGAPIAHIANAARLTRQAIYDIKNSRK